MQEFDLRAMFYLLLARIKWILSAVVVGSVLLGAYAGFIMPKQYTSTAMLYLTNLAENYDSSAATTGNLTAAERLAKTVQTATTSTWALEQASLELNGQLSPRELSHAVSFSAVSETSFLKIAITHTDPVMAQQACDVMARTAVNAFTATGEIGKASVYQTAVVAHESSTSFIRMLVIGGVLGLVLSVSIVLILPLFNNTVSDKEEIQRRLNVPVLGEIPSFEMAAKGGKRNHG